MYTIRVIIQCPDEYNELLSDSLESAEYIIEELLGLALSELFVTVHVDDVTVTHTLPEGKRDGILPPAA